MILFCIVLPKEGPRLKLPQKHPPTVTHGTLASPVFVNRARCPQNLIHTLGLVPTDPKRGLKE